LVPRLERRQFQQRRKVQFLVLVIITLFFVIIVIVLALYRTLFQFILVSPIKWMGRENFHGHPPPPS